MAQGRNFLPNLAGYYEEASRAYDMALGTLSGPVACYSVGHDLAGVSCDLAQTTMPSASHAHELMSPGSCYETSPSTITSRLQTARARSSAVVNPQDIQNIKIEDQFLDIDSTPELTLTPEQQHHFKLSTESSTNVDTLMRTIQLKSQRPRRYKAPSPPSTSSPSALALDVKPVSPQLDRPANGRRRGRKSYECSIPSCAKTFYQKAHLEIHVRAHTGYKPFVSGLYRNYDLVAHAYTLWAGL